MKSVQLISLVLVIVGAVNWGLVGLAQFDLVAALFGGADTALARIVYSLVGVAGVALAVVSFAPQRHDGLMHHPSRA